MDLQYTSDGVAVIMHDYDVARTTNGTGLVSDMSFEAVKKLNAAAHFNNNNNNNKNNNNNINNNNSDSQSLKNLTNTILENYQRMYSTPTTPAQTILSSGVGKRYSAVVRSESGSPRKEIKRRSLQIEPGIRGNPDRDKLDSEKTRRSNNRPARSDGDSSSSDSSDYSDASTSPEKSPSPRRRSDIGVSEILRANRVVLQKHLSVGQVREQFITH